MPGQHLSDLIRGACAFLASTALCAPLPAGLALLTAGWALLVWTMSNHTIWALQPVTWLYPVLFYAVLRAAFALPALRLRAPAPAP